MKYAIVNVDFWEWDAFLVIEDDDTRYFFSFNGEDEQGKTHYPTLEDAIKFFEHDEWIDSMDALASLKRVGLYD